MKGASLSPPASRCSSAWHRHSRRELPVRLSRGYHPQPGVAGGAGCTPWPGTLGWDEAALAAVGDREAPTALAPVFAVLPVVRLGRRLPVPGVPGERWCAVGVWWCRWRWGDWRGRSRAVVGAVSRRAPRAGSDRGGAVRGYGGLPRELCGIDRRLVDWSGPRASLGAIAHSIGEQPLSTPVSAGATARPWWDLRRLPVAGERRWLDHRHGRLRSTDLCGWRRPSPPAWRRRLWRDATEPAQVRADVGRQVQRSLGRDLASGGTACVPVASRPRFTELKGIQSVRSRDILPRGRESVTACNPRVRSAHLRSREIRGGGDGWATRQCRPAASPDNPGHVSDRIGLLALE